MSETPSPQTPANAPNGAPPPSTPPATPPGEVTFTPEQQAIFDRAVGKARQEGRESGAKQAQAAVVPPQEPPPAAKMTKDDLIAQVESLKLQGRYQMLAMDEGLKGAQANILFHSFAALPAAEQNADGLKALVTTLGIKPTAAQPATVAPTGTPAPTTPPISDKGSPAPGMALDWERDLAENPIGMHPASVQRGIAKYGEVEFNRMRMAAAASQMARIKVTK